MREDRWGGVSGQQVFGVKGQTKSFKTKEPTDLHSEQIKHVQLLYWSYRLVRVRCMLGVVVGRALQRELVWKEQGQRVKEGRKEGGRVTLGRVQYLLPFQRWNLILQTDRQTDRQVRNEAQLERKHLENRKDWRTRQSGNDCWQFSSVSGNQKKKKPKFNFYTLKFLKLLNPTNHRRRDDWRRRGVLHRQQQKKKV